MDDLSQNTVAAGMPVKLTDWKNPPSLENLKQDLTEARPIHDGKVAKIKNWLTNLEEGGAPPKDAALGSSKIAPKLVRKQAEWRYPALSEPFLSTNDVFNVKPVSWEDKKAAEQNKMVLNHQFNTQIDKVKFIDEYVRTAVDEGTVVLRVSWVFEERETEEDIPQVQYVVAPEFAPMIEQLTALKEQDPVQYKADVPEELRQAHQLSIEQGQPVKPVVTSVQRGKKMRTVKNQPRVEICDYRNVVIDPTCYGDLDKAAFAGYSFESSLAELKRDSRYKNLDFVEPSLNSVLASPDHSGAQVESNSFNFKDKPRQKVVVQEYWGYWDINGDGTVEPFVAAWIGSTLVRMELSPYPDRKLPFILVHYLPVRRSTHGEPDGALLEDNQKVIGAVTRGMIDLLGKSANGQTGMRKDMLDATNKIKFQRGQDYEFNSNMDPRMGVHMHTYPEIPQSAQVMLQLQNMEAESLTGVKSFSQGIGGQSLGDVAAGVRGALDASSKRELGILRRLAEGIVKVGRKFIAMNAQWLSEEEVVRVTNEEFVLVRRDDLAGNFDLELSISTAEEDNNKAEQLAFMFQTIGPNGDAGMTKMILADIARLRKMPDLAKRIETFQPQPDPMQQKLQEMEIAKLEAEIAEIQARTMKYQADAQLSGAKIGTEGAKATHLKSDSDLKNLDFVEQESGVKQERDLQLHGEQARSQVQLKLIDQQTKREDRKVDLLKEYVKTRAKAKAA